MPDIEPIDASFEDVARSLVVRKAPPQPEFQIPLPLVQYELEHEVIYQRVKDGYVNATAMCKAAGREWSSYRRSADAFVAALEGACKFAGTS